MEQMKPYAVHDAYLQDVCYGPNKQKCLTCGGRSMLRMRCITTNDRLRFMVQTVSCKECWTEVSYYIERLD